VSVILCTVFCLIVALFCVKCVVCVLCLIVVPLPLGENPFAVKINKNIVENGCVLTVWKVVCIRTTYIVDNGFVF
jgi:hypothetical protein